jgi:hypothetical protein
MPALFRKVGEILMDYTGLPWQYLSESPLWESHHVNKVDQTKDHGMDDTYRMLQQSTELWLLIFFD